MTENCTERAREWLDGKREGAFGDMVSECLRRGGVVHASADCFLAGFPAEDDGRVLHVAFQCSRLRRLREVLEALGYERVRWRRDFGHGEGYGERERAISDFRRHDRYGLNQ